MTPSREAVLHALKGVIDPELGLDVVSLGLVYGVEVGPGGLVRVDLTMTTPACPLSEDILEQAYAALGEVPGVEAPDVQLVWEPRWTPDRMSDEARQHLGWSR